MRKGLVAQAQKSNIVTSLKSKNQQPKANKHTDRRPLHPEPPREPFSIPTSEHPQKPPYHEPPQWVTRQSTPTKELAYLQEVCRIHFLVRVYCKLEHRVCQGLAAQAQTSQSVTVRNSKTINRGPARKYKPRSFPSTSPATPLNTSNKGPPPGASPGASPVPSGAPRQMQENLLIYRRSAM